MLTMDVAAGEGMNIVSASMNAIVFALAQQCLHVTAKNGLGHAGFFLPSVLLLAVLTKQNLLKQSSAEVCARLQTYSTDASDLLCTEREIFSSCAAAFLGFVTVGILLPNPKRKADPVGDSDADEASPVAIMEGSFETNSRPWF